MRISDWSSDVCSSDLPFAVGGEDIGGAGLQIGSHIARCAQIFDIALGDPTVQLGTADPCGVGVERAEYLEPRLGPGAAHDPRRLDIFEKQIGRASCRESVWQYV